MENVFYQNFFHFFFRFFLKNKIKKITTDMALRSKSKLHTKYARIAILLFSAIAKKKKLVDLTCVKLKMIFTPENYMILKDHITN